MHSTSQYTDLLRSLDGMKNWRATVLMIGSFILAFVMVGATGLLGVLIGKPAIAMILSLLSSLIAALIAVFGINAAGIVLMRQALDQPQPGIAEALAGGMASFVKLLLIGLMFIGGWLVFILASVVLLFLCKIPYVGPVLYAVVFPLLVLLSGIAYLGTAFGGGLMAPAIWRGATIRQALRQFWAILCGHLVETVIRFLLLVLLLAVVFGVLGGILVSGVSYTLALSSGVIGGVLVANSFTGSGHAVAMGFGTGFLGVLLAGGAFCAYTMGMISIYLGVCPMVDARANSQKTPAADAKMQPGCPSCQTTPTDGENLCSACGQQG